MKWPNIFRFRYSLRALLVFVTLFMLWGGYHANRGWKQRRAESILRNHGAAIGYGQLTDRDRGFASRIQRAYWLLVHRLWGERYINSVYLWCPMEPEVVDALVALPQLPMLSIQSQFDNPEETTRVLRTGIATSKSPFPPGSLERILERHEVEVLWLSMWIVDDRACGTIAAEPTLRQLQIAASDMTESGFAELITTPQLRSFKVMSCQVTGDGLGSVSGSESLERIECFKTPVGERFAAFVGRSPRVKELQIRYGQIDDRFVAALKSHPSLENVGLHGGVITDTAVDAFEIMPSLTVLGLPKGSLSTEAVDRLVRANPNLIVHEQK